MRINFILKCTECGEENYLTQKNIVHVAKNQQYTKKKQKNS